MKVWIRARVEARVGEGRVRKLAGVSIRVRVRVKQG